MIRDAVTADAPAIARLWNPIIRDSVITFTSLEKSEAEVAELIESRAARGHPFLVAEAEGAVVGFASYFTFRDGPGYARTREHSVNLAPEAQGRGLGRALMSALETRARAQDVHSLIGAVSGENMSSIRFHERLGFRQAGRLQAVGWKFGRFHDLVLMQKLL